MATSGRQRTRGYEAPVGAYVSGRSEGVELGSLILTAPFSCSLPKAQKGHGLSEKALRRIEARGPSKLMTRARFLSSPAAVPACPVAANSARLPPMCCPDEIRASRMPVFQFVTARKMLLRSIRTDTQVCNFKPLKLLNRVTPPGPTIYINKLAGYTRLVRPSNSDGATAGATDRSPTRRSCTVVSSPRLWLRRRPLPSRQCARLLESSAARNLQTCRSSSRPTSFWLSISKRLRL
jgi:hypothetical protein